MAQWRTKTVCKRFSHMQHIRHSHPVSWHQDGPIKSGPGALLAYSDPPIFMADAKPVEVIGSCVELGESRKKRIRHGGILGSAM